MGADAGAVLPGSDRPAVVVFDVNETLSDLTPMQARFAEVGAPGSLAATWFAAVLRDGFALTAAGSAAPFATIAAGVLRTLLTTVDLHSDVEDAVDHVISGFAALEVHPDVPDGVRMLRRSGLRLVTLTNGATSISEGLLSRAGIRSEFDRLLSVDDVGAWKPARAAYEHAAAACGTAPPTMLLVAVHPWDIDGAARAGLRTAWIDRAGGPYPGHMTAPHITVSGITDLAATLTA